jgi:hypothetical protein
VVQFLRGPEIFLFCKVPGLSLDSTQPLIQQIVRAFSLGVKWLECEANNSAPSGAEIMNDWSCTLIAVYAFMACMLTALPFTLVP